MKKKIFLPAGKAYQLGMLYLFNIRNKNYKHQAAKDHDIYKHYGFNIRNKKNPQGRE